MEATSIGKQDRQKEKRMAAVDKKKREKDKRGLVIVGAIILINTH